MRRNCAVRRSFALAFAACLISASAIGQAAVTCDDTGLTYETTCVNQPSGTRCINVANQLSPIGCCNKGTCDGHGVCDLTNPGGTGDDATCLNDNNTCTSDRCLGQIGSYQAQCFHDPVASGTFCVADSNLCTNDACDGSGNCVATNAAPGSFCIADSNNCTDDGCDGNGTCVATNSTSGKPCGNIDGNVCTRDQCNGSGSCVVGFGGTEDCSGMPPPSNQCKQNTCDPQDGCGPTNKPDGASCNDGKDCTRGDNCQNGHCGRGSGSQGIQPSGTPCRDDNTSNPSNRTWCKPGTCNGTDEACRNTQTLSSGSACDPNPCTNAYCQSNGGQCLVTSCNAPSILCPNCGNTQCNPSGTTGDANGLIMCGCLSVLE